MNRSLAIILLSGLFLSARAGSAQDVHWLPTTADPGLHVRMLHIVANGDVFAGTDEGLIRSLDNGASWSLVGPAGVNDLAEHDGQLVTAGYWGVHASRDGGATWQELVPEVVRDNCRWLQHIFVEIVGDVLLVGGSREDPGGSPCKIYDFFLRSIDFGATWTSRISNEPDRGAASSEGHLYFGTSQGTVIRVEPDLLSGTTVSTDLGASVTALQVSKSGALFAGTGDSIASREQNPSGSGTGVFRSPANGTSWIPKSNGLTDLSIEAMAFAGSTLYVATYSGGVFRSFDGGDVWEAFNTGLPSLHTSALAVSPDGFGFVATDQGIFRSSMALGTANEPETGIPSQVSLLPSYPNPFSRQAVIPFELGSPGRVRLAVYDLLGREISVLLDEIRTAGRQEAPFEAGERPSGVYVVELRAGGVVTRRNMVLMR